MVNPEDKVMVDMMESHWDLIDRIREYDWIELKCKVLRIPHSDGKTSMYTFLPKMDDYADVHGNLHDVEQRLSEFDYLVFRDEDATMGVWSVTMPMMKVESRLRHMGRIMADAGAPDAFIDEQADLSGIVADGGRPGVTQIVYKVVVEFGEEGGEPAVRNTTEGPTMIHPDRSLNRPFAFVVRCDVSGLILFQGRVTDPSALPYTD